jgi:DNA helicase IV
MKKFSSISGQKVNEEPKVEASKELNELMILKAGIIKLMDNLLTIQTYGSTRRDIIQNNVKITGKEMFAEALIDFLGDKSLNDQIKALESLKSESRDWQSIDNKVNDLHNEISEKLTLSDNVNQIKKIKTFLETYGSDERFDSILETYTNRVKNGKEAYLRSLTANKMASDANYTNYSKDKLSRISDRFLNRAKELGF